RSTVGVTIASPPRRSDFRNVHGSTSTPDSSTTRAMANPWARAKSRHSVSRCCCIAPQRLLFRYTIATGMAPPFLKRRWDAARRRVRWGVAAAIGPSVSQHSRLWNRCYPMDFGDFPAPGAKSVDRNSALCGTASVEIPAQISPATVPGRFRQCVPGRSVPQRNSIITKGNKMAGGSTLPKRALGRELRRLRERSGTNQAAAARAIEVSPQTIGRLEDGHASRPTTLQINGLCDRYGASDEERRFVLDLVQELRAMKLSGGG